MPLDARRQAYLDAMDIDVWVSRNSRLDAETVPVVERGTGVTDLALTREADVSPSANATSIAQTSSVPAPAEMPGDVDAGMPGDDDLPPLDAYLDVPPPDDDDDFGFDLPLQAGVSQFGWDDLARHVAACTRCDLHKTRTQTVFGIGDRKARLMIVGEAPGRDEDQQGEPFVGRAGQLLNAMLKAIGLVRDQVYIANVLKCRPPNNRDPQAAEVAACSGYLWRQLQLIEPDVLVALGRHAAHSLLETSDSLARLRGQSHGLRDFNLPVVVTYHPAYLLRTPADKRKAWEDLRFVRRLLQN
ncbi:MAG: uracil-DNA glycosylase [Gammaproteobacteria bacterium]|nr:uracil-DNA glycosylase [Gammaproteobacteria bacterium]MCP5135868.1 uracil-DNA glycosylase [Gammaproteobacteria bacterium]